MLLVALAALADAHAAWPDDVLISQLGTFGGQPVTSEQTIQDAYHSVVRQLGMTIANTPEGAVETLGINGFSLGMTSTVGFIDAGDADAPWRRVHESGEPTRALWVPSVQVRKGLPLSLEAGAELGYVAFSRQTTFGAWGRAGLIEGYRQIPDFTLQIGYAGYVGNPELAVGTMDASLAIGKTLPFGQQLGINAADIAPYAGVGWYHIRAMPRLDAAEQEELGIGSVSGFRSSESYAEGFAPFGVHAGFRVRSGDFQLSLSGNLSPGVVGSVAAGVGYTY